LRLRGFALALGVGLLLDRVPLFDGRGIHVGRPEARVASTGLGGMHLAGVRFPSLVKLR
jgi:hypothetical protein